MADVELLVVSVETGFQTVNAEKGASTLPKDIQALDPISIDIADVGSRLNNKLVVPTTSVDILTSNVTGILEKQVNTSKDIFISNNEDFIIEDTLTTANIIADGYDSLGGYDFFQSHGDNVTWNIGYGGFTGLNSGTPVTPATASNVLGSNINNLFAAYDGSTFSGTTWSDDINTYDTNNSTGSPAISSSQLNGYDIVEGSTSDGLKWPTGILPSNYTLFHVTRYNGSTKKRIFSASNTNWLSGFHSGKAGVAYHNAWVGPQTDYHGTDWVISTDQRYLYRSNGVTRGTNGSSEGDLTINMGQHSEKSDWQCAEVIIFDRQLTQSEYEDVEEYLSKKYNIPLNGTVATSWPFGGNYGAGGISYNSTQTSSITYDSAIGDMTIVVNDYPKTSIITSKDFSTFSNSTYNPVNSEFYSKLDSDELRELKVNNTSIITAYDISSKSPSFVNSIQKQIYINNAVPLGYFEVDGIARISDINQNNDPRLIGGTIAVGGGGGGDSAAGVAGPIQAWSS
jgi:hypothetical protein